MSEFKTFWGDMAVTGKVTDAPKDDKKEDPKKGETVDDPKGEEVKDVKEKPEEPEKEKKGEDAGDDQDKGDGEPEYEFTEDDISKAYTMLLEEDVLEAEEDQEFEGTTTGLADAVAATVQSKLKKEIAAIPEVVQEFYSHVINGEDPSSFTPTQAETMWDEYDISEEAAQEATLRALYKSQEMTEEDIEEEIEDIKAADKLEKKAEIAKNTLAKAQKTRIANTAKAKEQATKDAEKAALKEVDDIKKSIDDMKEIAGFELTDKRKTAFKDYLFKVQPRTGKTQMQDNMADKDRRMTIAFLDFVNYTKADLAKEEATKLTKQRKKKLVRFSDKNVKNKNSSATVTTDTDNKTKGKLIIPGIFGPQKIEIED